MGRIPKVSEQYEWNGLRLEIMDLDGNRIDKVLVTTFPVMPSNNEQTGT